MTRRQVVTTRRADEDIDGAIDHYLGEGAEDAGLGFIDALADARNLLAEHPHIGSARLTAEIGLPDLRTFALPRYPYILSTAEDAGFVRIIRVLHTSRDIPAELLDER